FLILYVKKNISESNKLKFGRDIRKAIKKATGMMTSGGEDRIKIVTPKDKELAARAAATEKKQLAAEARERKEQQNAQRKIKREELKLKRAEKRAQKAERAQTESTEEARTEAPRKAEKSRKTEKPRRERTPRAEKPEPEPKPVVTPEQVEARWEEAGTTQEGWLESEAKAQDLEANAISVGARAEAFRDQADESQEALEGSTKHLHDLREALKKAGGRAKFDLQKEIAREETKKQTLQAEFQRLNEAALALEAETSQQTEALAQAREEAMVKQVEAAEARLEAAKAEQESASEDDDDPEASEETAREIADAARQLAVAKAELDIVASLKQINTALVGIDHDSESQEFKSTRVYIGALMWENKQLKKGVEKLREAVSRIESASDRIRILATHWAHHPEIEWAESAVDMLVES
ncbi:MAG: hypothetical protein ACI8RZ_007446, partial [Myxococcota bacterium]